MSEQSTYGPSPLAGALKGYAFYRYMAELSERSFLLPRRLTGDPAAGNYAAAEQDAAAFEERIFGDRDAP